jgi:hypothetical protein
VQPWPRQGGKGSTTLYEFIKKEIASLDGVINTKTFVGAMVQKTYYEKVEQHGANKDGEKERR